MITKAEIKDAGNGVLVEVRDERSWVAVGFLLFWLCGWAAGELFAGGALFTGRANDDDGEPAGWGIRLFLIGWLGFWTLGGLAAMHEVLRMLTGRWIITIDGKVLTVRHKVLGMGRTRSYETHLIRDFRLAPEELAHEGAFRFDYENDTVALAPHLTYAQAKSFFSRLACLPYLKITPKTAESPAPA